MVKNSFKLATDTIDLYIRLGKVDELSLGVPVGQVELSQRLPLARVGLGQDPLCRLALDDAQVPRPWNSGQIPSELHSPGWNLRGSRWWSASSYSIPLGSGTHLAMFRLTRLTSWFRVVFTVVKTRLRYLS